MTDDVTRSLLQANHNNLINEYLANVLNISAVQKTLVDDVLPHIRDEFHLPQEDVAWAHEWLQDTATIFRILRRHRFTRSFTIEAIRTIILWRLNVLRPVLRVPQPDLLHCLPPSVTDLFGRPIVFLKVSSLDELKQDAKDVLLPAIEQLRLHLQSINKHRDTATSVVLQFVFVVDLQGVSLHSFNAELISWLMREVIPRFPGMLAAVFLLNYSWAHSGMWSIAKRILPVSAISRVFFPSQDELLQIFSPSALPQDYGGLLPVLDSIDDPLPRLDLAPPSPDLRQPQPSHLDSAEVTMPTSLSRTPSTICIPPTSFLNPFYGYPILTSSRHPHIFRPTRRRKRDLLRTLAFLWWRRWGIRTLTALCIIVSLLMVRPRLRRWLPVIPAINTGRKMALWQQLRLNLFAYRLNSNDHI